MRRSILLAALVALVTLGSSARGEAPLQGREAWRRAMRVGSKVQFNVAAGDVK